MPSPACETHTALASGSAGLGPTLAPMGELKPITPITSKRPSSVEMARMRCRKGCSGADPRASMALSSIAAE